MTDRIGNCRILGEIGSGGMAVVYKAVQEPLGRIVAIKALKPSIAVDSQFAKRFEREAHFMASLQHENVLHVHDFIKDGRTMYIVMEYVRGIDLYDLLDRTPVLPVDVAAIIALQVARALDYAHFRGVIHRDIKPANVMISHHGEVKLMDFGIARDDTLTDLTETGTGLGTPSYMSPEQILGDKLDFRSDLFSLGIVLYQTITGKKPFVEDDTRTVMQKIRLDRFTPPKKLNPKVPRVLERILARCMEKMPANRYPTTQALIDDLMEFLSQRVPMNHNSRLVMYLREVAFLTDDEAEEILAVSGARGGTRRSHTDRRMVADVGAVMSLALMVALGGAGVIQGMNGTLWPDARSLETQGPVVPEDPGYLRVVVDPWAVVKIRGREIVTTPTARAIPLAAGTHDVTLTNPYFVDQDHQVQIDSGETVVLDVTLQPAVAPPGSSDGGTAPGEP